MSFLRVSTVSGNVILADLGYTIAHPTTNLVLSNQFSVEDLQNSVALVSAVQGGQLSAEVLLDGVWTAAASGDFDSKDIYAAAANIFELVNTVDNEKLVDGSDASTLHSHDSIYHTKTELGSVSGAGLIGVDNTNLAAISGGDVQEVLENINDYLENGIDLDAVYDNDANGIMLVDNVSKDLDLRSNNLNDIVISRVSGVDTQDALRFDVSAHELVLGSVSSGGLPAVDVRIKNNILIDGNLTIIGAITDTTVDELNVTNANIRLRDGATGIAGDDAAIIVERGTSGADASLKWDHAASAWYAGLEGSEQKIALVDTDEVITGVYEFQGGGVTEPSMFLTDKSAAPSANLGTASQYPVALITGILCVYDKSNSRNKFLSVNRVYATFSGRDNANNSNEYARIGLFTSNQAGFRLMRNATLVGVSAQTNGAETWNARIRKNGVVTNLASLAISAASGGQDNTLNVDFDAGDSVDVFIDGTSINRPVIVLEFAYRF